MSTPTHALPHTCFLQWEAVARKLDSGRTAVQCLQAYIKTARPEGHATKGRSLWSPEDTAMLEQLVAKHGTQWVVSYKVD
jgi:hypothetical protein